MRSAPSGTRLVRQIGTGAVFDVAVVRLADGAEAIAKRPSPRFGDSGLGPRAVAREAEVLAAIDDASVPRLLARGEDVLGPFVVESIAAGAPLREVDSGSVEPGAWLLVAASASAALARLHEARHRLGELPGFVHGDVSPDNLVVDGRSRVTLVDFSGATWSGDVAPVFPDARGTLPYVAPEIARGERAPDAAGDTYALAAVLAWLAAGRMTEAEGGAALLAEVGDRGVSLERLYARDGLPRYAVEALRDALAFDRVGRLVSSRELARRLGER